MCGLIYNRRLDGMDARNTTLARYREQKTRGKEGYGFVALNNETVLAYERAETEDEIVVKLEKTACSDILFHHRIPTSTPNFLEAAHPIFVSHKKLKHDYYVIHNGIILDCDDWKKQHEAEGYKYSTEMVGGWLVGGILRDKEIKYNDSEALAIELAIDLDAGGGGVNCSGSIAFIAVEVDKKTKKATRLLWGRNISNPLVFDFVPQSYMVIASEGDGERCKPDTLYCMDYADGALTSRPYHVGLEDERPIITTFAHIDVDAPNLNYTAGFDMPDKYYIMLENRAELETILKNQDSKGQDTEDTEMELEYVNDQVLEMELAHDKRHLDNTLAEDASMSEDEHALAGFDRNSD